MKKQRLELLDTIRGITIISMVIYHAAWDFVYILGFDWEWYRSVYAHIWQQSICWTFILLSGFCFTLGKKHLKRGLTVFGAGALTTAVTLIFVPEDRVIFGVLTLLGSAMLIMIPLDRLLHRVNSAAGAAVSFVLFGVFKNVQQGYMGFFGAKLVEIPDCFYSNYITAYLGFPQKDFFSTDYFPILPWIFLFITGCFIGRLFKEKNLFGKPFEHGLKPLSFIGRHSLIIYLAHQPVIYLLIVLLPQIIKNLGA